MEKLGEFPDGIPEALQALRRPFVRNARGPSVGEIIADAPLEPVSPA